MSALKVSLLGLMLGATGYAICALAFWYNVLNFAVVGMATVLGIAFLGLAIVSAIAAAVVLIITLANKLDHGVKHHG